MGLDLDIKKYYSLLNMKKIYKLKPYHQLQQDPTGSDRKKRDKVEEVLNKKLTDTEWFNYKIMLQGIKR